MGVDVVAVGTQSDIDPCFVSACGGPARVNANEVAAQRVASTLEENTRPRETGDAQEVERAASAPCRKRQSVGSLASTRARQLDLWSPVGTWLRGPINQNRVRDFWKWFGQCDGVRGLVGIVRNIERDRRPRLLRGVGVQDRLAHGSCTSVVGVSHGDGRGGER